MHRGGDIKRHWWVDWQRSCTMASATQDFGGGCGPSPPPFPKKTQTDSIGMQAEKEGNQTPALQTVPPHMQEENLNS